MRVLGVTPYYVPEGGGLERYAHEVFRRLVERGHEVHVVAFTHGDEPGVDRVQGVTVDRRVPRWRFSNTPVDPLLVRELATVIEGYEPDVVSAHGPVPFPTEMAALACRRTGTPLVVTYHAGRLTGPSIALKAAAAIDRWTLEALAHRTASRLVAVSQFVADNALINNRFKTVVIPPGVDHGLFRAPPYPAPTQDVLYVGGVSRAYAWKGFHVLYDAFREIAPLLPHANLVAVGTGDLLDHYRERAVADGLAERVRFPGRLDDDALREQYHRAAVTCLPSVSPAESFGMVLAEAQACARPVVATRVGGIPEAVVHGVTGILVPPRDAPALASALHWVLTHPEEAARMGEAGRARVVQNHDWDHLARRHEDVLMDAAGYRTVRTVAPGVGDFPSSQ